MPRAPPLVRKAAPRRRQRPEDNTLHASFRLQGEQFAFRHPEQPASHQAQAGAVPDRRRIHPPRQVFGEVSGNRGRISSGAVTTIHLLLLTACRRNEILTLLWEHVDLDKAEVRIVDAKTGARTVHLSPSAVHVLNALPRKPDNPWEIPEPSQADT